jgi:hypothetical protein
LSHPAQLKSNRRNLILALAVSVIGMLLVGGVAVLASGRGGEAAGLGSEGPYRGSEPPVRMSLPHFELRSYGGGLVTTRELRGQVVLLTLLDSQCTERARFWLSRSLARSTA